MLGLVIKRERSIYRVNLSWYDGTCKSKIPYVNIIAKSESKKTRSACIGKILEIYKLDESYSSQIIVPLNDKSDAKYISIANSKQLNFKLHNWNTPESLWDKVRTQFLLQFILQFVFFLWAINYFNKKAAYLRSELKKAENQSDKLSSEFIEIKNETIETKKVSTRLKAILHRKLYDSKRENSFWRDTLRKALYVRTGNIATVNGLMHVVNSTLQSHKKADKETVEEIEKILLDF